MQIHEVGIFKMLCVIKGYPSVNLDFEEDRNLQRLFKVICEQALLGLVHDPAVVRKLINLLDSQLVFCLTLLKLVG